MCAPMRICGTSALRSSVLTLLQDVIGSTLLAALSYISDSCYSCASIMFLQPALCFLVHLCSMFHSWSMLFDAVETGRQFDTAVTLLDNMRERGQHLPINEITYGALLGACGRVKRLMQVHTYCM